MMTPPTPHAQSYLYLNVSLVVNKRSGSGPNVSDASLVELANVA